MSVMKMTVPSTKIMVLHHEMVVPSRNTIILCNDTIISCCNVFSMCVGFYLDNRMLLYEGANYFFFPCHSCTSYSANISHLYMKVDDGIGCIKADAYDIYLLQGIVYLLDLFQVNSKAVALAPLNHPHIYE